MKKLITMLQLLVVILVIYGIYFVFRHEIRAIYHKHIAPLLPGSMGDPIERSQIAEQCRNNLRAIDRSKTAFAQHNNLFYGEEITAEDLQPYLTSSDILKCPGGGKYTLHSYGTLPSCSIGFNLTPNIQEDNHIIGIR